MLVSIVGYFLALSVALHIFIIYFVYRQRIQSLLVPLFIYLNLLVMLEEIASIFLLGDSPIPYAHIVIKIRLVVEAFIPAILFHLSQNYYLSSDFPTVKIKNIFFFVTSTILALLGLSNMLFNGITTQNGITYPRYNFYFLLYLGYFAFVFYILLYDFFQKYLFAKRKIEITIIKNFLTVVFPLSIFAFAMLHLAPFFGLIHPGVFLAYPIFSILVFYTAAQYRIIEFDNLTANNILFFLVSLFYLALLPFIHLIHPPFNFLLLSLLMVLAFTSIQYLNHLIQTRIRLPYEEETYDLEKELEHFLGQIGQFIDLQALARFSSDFFQRIFRCTKSAIVISRFDIQPYQIVTNQGFEAGELNRLLTDVNSPILDKIENDRKILNKFDYPSTSSVYKALERAKIYLILPLTVQNELKGFFFLGGERRITHFTAKDLRFARMLSVQVAIAIQNIQSIQSAVQSQKLAELGVFASQIAHDFQSFITLVKLDSSPDKRLRQHAAYMEKLVKDLLNYARPQELKLKAVDINQLINMTLDLVHLPPNIVLEKHFSDNLPPVHIDVNQMRRVFINLFENSIRAMKESGGRLKISTRPLRPLSKLRQSPWIYVEILDEGEGIPEEFLDRIFDPFFTTHKQEGGNGMGLAIVKQIINRHNGFIDVTSMPGKGTIFNIRLPNATRS